MMAENQVAASATAGGLQDGTLVQLLIQRARNASAVGVAYKKDGRWHDVTFAQLLEEVKALSAALVAQGVNPGDRVALFANTSLQWLVCDVAISAARAITVPIYGSSTPDECRHILSHSEATFVFVDHDEEDPRQPGRLTRLRQTLPWCPSVSKVVLFEGSIGGGAELSLADLMAQGRAAHAARPEAFDERVAAVSMEDTASLIYTSGTTGDPKGVILTHQNWAYEAKAAQSVGMMAPGDSVMLFLPLAHVFAQVVKAAWLSMGYRLIVAESVDTLLANLVETRPSVLPSVPRVFEKVYNNVVANGSASPGLKGRLFRWAFKLFDEYVEARSQGREYDSLGFALAKKLVFSKVRAAIDEKLGGNMRLFISGGAPLSPKIGYFFDLLGFKVLEGYGLTETAAGSTVNREHRIKIGTVGAPMPGLEVKIASDGEILIRGPSVMKGYYKDPEATAEAIDAEGWFHTGDIGELDADNYLRITDRKKDLIITAGGKNVAPQNLENALKTHGIISQALVFGDKRPYLVALVTVSDEASRKLLQEKGAPVGAYSENARRPEVHAAVEAAVAQVNAQQPPYATLKRFAVLENDFSQETGELTPKLSVKRRVCRQKYQAQLDGLYAGTAVVD